MKLIFFLKQMKLKFKYQKIKVLKIKGKSINYVMFKNKKLIFP